MVLQFNDDPVADQAPACLQAAKKEAKIHGDKHVEYWNEAMR